MLIILLCCCACDKGITTINHENGKCIIDDSLDQWINAAVPQNIEIFKNQIQEENLLQFQAEQKSLNEEYNKKFFAPWFQKQNFKTKKLTEFIKTNFYGEDLHKLPKSEINLINENISNATYVCLNGIAVKNTMTQAFPSNKPLFADIKRPGKSYPFDSNIKSMMKIGTPVNITSISADKKWFYVKSHLFNGWAFASDIALTSRSFEKNYMSKKYCIAIKDQISIEHNGSFIANVNIGVTLPVKNNKLLVPFRNSSGKAEILHCNITNGLVERPLKFTRENISNILKEMIGTKYGWGGYLENRDCSMLVSDFFAIFGKHLINYSGIQVSSGENVKDLNCKQKEDFIKQNGIPFLTLAGYEGHVMLYVGIYDDAPVFLHNVWGLRMSDNKNTRYIIGKTILSKFNLGNYKNLAERVNRVVFFSRKVNP